MKKRWSVSSDLLKFLVILAICLSSSLTIKSGNAQALIQTGDAAGKIRSFELLAAGQGWILLDQKLYWSQLSGASWVEITPPGTSSLWAVDFIDTQRGWAVISSGFAAALPGGEPEALNFQLASTSDGGQSWISTALPKDPFPDLPDLAPEAISLSYNDSLKGQVHFKRPTSSNFSLYSSYQTLDGGQSWQRLVDDVTPPVQPSPLQSPELNIPQTSGQITQLSTLDQSFCDTQPSACGFQPAISFAWALVEQGSCTDKVNCTQVQSLLSTSDAGQSWQEIAPPPGTMLSASPLAPGLQISGQGFDKCEIPTLTQLQEWWNQGPYTAVNLYFGGILRACSNNALTPTYLSDLDKQGWRLIPTWVGPQASCSGFEYVMSPDPSTAYQQGVAEANAAASEAMKLKLWGQVLYYDLEAFPTDDPGCLDAAKAFMNGWTFRLHEWGFISGVYGSPCSSGLASFLTAPNPPEAAWIAHWLSPPAYDPAATVWISVCGFSDSYWSDHQRLRQYAGGHPETWGSVTLMIDSSVMDGYVAQAFGQPQAICPRPADPAKAGVILYTAANYDCYGRQSGFGYVWRDRSGFQNLSTFFNERASSIYIPPGWSAMLYEDRDKAGGKICINAPGDANFAVKTFDNGHNLDSLVSSFEVFAGKNCTQPAPHTPPIDTQVPNVQITSQVNGDSISFAAGPLVIKATLSDSGSGISHAQFFGGADTGSGWTWQSLGYDNNPADGWSSSWSPVHLMSLNDLGIYVVAWDQAGNSAGAAVLHLSSADSQPPTTAIQPLPASQESTVIPVTWQASDNLSGIRYFDLQVQDNSGAWIDWLTNYPGDQTSALYYGQLGHSYGFRLRAIDMAGNQNAYPVNAEAATKVNACSGDTAEPDNALASAKPLKLNEIQAHTLCGINDQDWLSFSVSAGTSYQFSTSSLGPPTDTVLGLYTFNGVLIAESDNAGSSLFSRLFYPAPADGTVFLKIRHKDGRVAGNAVTYSVSAAQTTLQLLPYMNKR